MRKRILILTCFFLLFAHIAGAQVPQIKHVVIIGCDGFTTNGLLNAKTPNIDKLKESGVYTLDSKAIHPTTSIPNWASMLLGAGQNQHGANKNGWKPRNIGPKKCGPEWRLGFPSIFDIIKAQRPELITAMFYNWDGLRKLVEKDRLDVLKKCKKPVECAVEYFGTHKPNLTFIYIDLMDSAGHDHGFESEKYIQTVEKVDSLVGVIMRTLQKTGMTESTAVFVATDHGGVGKTHGYNRPPELYVPWILSGPGIVPNHSLTTKVNVYDTAATIAYIFGLTPPTCWIGVPVKEAFLSNAENQDPGQKK